MHIIAPPTRHAPLNIASASLEAPRYPHAGAFASKLESAASAASAAATILNFGWLDYNLATAAAHLGSAIGTATTAPRTGVPSGSPTEANNGAHLLRSALSAVQSLQALPVDKRQGKNAPIASTARTAADSLTRAARSARDAG